MSRKSKNEHSNKSLAGENGSSKPTPSHDLGTVNTDPAGVIYMTYQEQLKSPKWQKKRLEILERDGFKCRICGEDNKELHVHHIFYDKGKNLWEYENRWLTSICSECHEKLHISINDMNIAVYLLYETYGKKSSDQLVEFMKTILK